MLLVAVNARGVMGEGSWLGHAPMVVGPFRWGDVPRCVVGCGISLDEFAAGAETIEVLGNEVASHAHEVALS